MPTSVIKYAAIDMPARVIIYAPIDMPTRVTNRSLTMCDVFSVWFR